jgi:UDP-N-acetylglucosamine/UDP-N-acetylgalactosamine diphosphorylase
MSAQVLEYSELDPAKASSINPATGELFYNWSNICMHYFAVPWLAAAAEALGRKGAYHIARKQIPSKGGVKVAGVKLEMFIFDPFGTTGSATTLMEVGREVEAVWGWRGADGVLLYAGTGSGRGRCRNLC